MRRSTSRDVTLVEKHLALIRAEKREADADYEGALLRNKSGIKGNLHNAALLLSRHPQWAGVIAGCDFTLATVARKPTPWGRDGAWTAADDLEACTWLQAQGCEVTVETVAQAVELVASQHRFHPVRDYLDSVKWDSTPRIDTWLTEYLGVAPSHYSAAVGARFLISAVARVMKPGCKADCMPVLEGPQGAKKSTAWRTLASPWFTDHLPDLQSKDAIMQLRGAWIVEVAELDALGRAESSRVKSFLSTSVDRYRPPYGRRVIEAPRQCVFTGTVNVNDWAKDSTGARRFWPVECGRIDIDRLAADRDQLWAEALVGYRDDRVWWLDSPELINDATEEQEARYDADPWYDVVLRWIDDRESVTTADVLRNCITKPQEHWTKADQMRIAGCLRAMGFHRRRVRERGWVYERRAGGVQ